MGREDTLTMYLSEDDFKFSFALAAKECGAENIVLEFPIKTKELYKNSKPTIQYFKNKKGETKFEDSKSYIDISFIYEGTRYFIELKFKVVSVEVKRYGMDFKLSEQGAGNIGLYSFHEDIERMEFIRDSYPNAKSFCILLSNNSYYWNNHKEDSMAFKARLTDTTRKADEIKEFKIGKREYRNLQCQNQYKTWHGDDNDVFKKINDSDSKYKTVFKVLVIETKTSKK